MLTLNAYHENVKSNENIGPKKVTRKLVNSLLHSHLVLWEEREGYGWIDIIYRTEHCFPLFISEKKTLLHFP